MLAKVDFRYLGNETLTLTLTALSTNYKYTLIHTVKSHLLMAESSRTPTTRHNLLFYARHSTYSIGAWEMHQLSV